MGSRSSAAASHRSASGAGDPRSQAAAEPGAARTKARAGRDPARASAAYLARRPLCRSASACCSLAAASGTRVRPDAGLVPQLLPRVPRRSTDLAPRVPTPRPPARLRVRWFQARRRRGHSPLPAGAATSPGRAPRSLAAAHQGARLTAPPGEHPEGRGHQGTRADPSPWSLQDLRTADQKCRARQLKEPGREHRHSREHSFSILSPLLGQSLGAKEYHKMLVY